MSRKTSLTVSRLDSRFGGTPPRSPKINAKAAMDEINELKVQTSQMDQETIRLKSKISRMKQIIQDRNTQINKALSATTEAQTIKTASKTTLAQLRENISSLRNTLQSREAELEKLRQNDKLALSDELQVEVLEYYNEYDRLKTQIGAVKEGERVINDEISRVQQEIVDQQQHEREIYDLQVQINTLADKLTAYLQGEYRVIANTAIEQMEKNKDLYPKLKKKLKKSIKEMEKDKIEEEEAIKAIHENNEKQKKYLRKILEDQAQKIAEAIEAQKEQKEKLNEKK